jgi:hypothetical protein
LSSGDTAGLSRSSFHAKREGRRPLSNRTEGRRNSRSLSKHFQKEKRLVNTLFVAGLSIAVFQAKRHYRDSQSFVNRDGKKVAAQIKVLRAA